MALRWQYTLPLLFTLLPLGFTHADENVQVNVLVFAQPDHGVSFELWRPTTELRLEYPVQRIDFKGLQAEIDERYTDLGLLPSDRINRAAERLQSNDYRVLVKQSWVQPVIGPRQSQSIVLKGGQSFGDVQELEGYVTIYESKQQLRLGTHLWLSRPTNANVAVPTTMPMTAPQLVETSPLEAPEVTHASEGPALTQAVQLNDTRILNIGELHYIDHPRFGMLIEILPPGGIPVESTPGTELGDDSTKPGEEGTGQASGADETIPEEAGAESTQEAE